MGMGSRCKGFLEVHYGDVEAKGVLLEAFLGFEVPVVRLSKTTSSLRRGQVRPISC
jgi:hypothetical protein